MFFPSDLIDVHLWPFDAVLKDIIQWPQYFIDTINLLPTTYFLYRLFEVVRRTLIVLQSYQHQLTSPDNSVVSNETPELSGYICSAFVGLRYRKSQIGRQKKDEMLVFHLTLLKSET